MSILTVYDPLTEEFKEYNAYLEPQTVSALLIHGHFDTLTALTSAVPRPQGGDAYTIGQTLPYSVYIYDSVHRQWQDHGALNEKGDAFTYDDFTDEQLAALAGEDGTKWYSGTAITGEGETITASDSGIASAKQGDYYLNTALGNVYKCTTGGAPSAAVWKYCVSFDEFVSEHNESSSAHSTLFSAKADLVSGKVKAEQASSDIVAVTASLTLTAAHAGKCLVCSNSAAITITVPGSSVLSVGTELEIVQYGEGSVTIAATDGVTVSSKDSALMVGGQYTAAVLKQLAANAWLLTGSIEGV